MQQKIDRAEKSLENIGNWIRTADQKASIILSLQGVILALLIPNYLKTITERFQTHTISFWHGTLVVVATLSLVIAIIESLGSIFPRLNNKSKSVLYFGTIKNMTLIKYINITKNLTASDYFNELCEQIHTNSNIAVTKHKQLCKSIIFFIIGMGFFVISYISFKFS